MDDELANESGQQQMALDDLETRIIESLEAEHAEPAEPESSDEGAGTEDAEVLEEDAEAAEPGAPEEDIAKRETESPAEDELDVEVAEESSEGETAEEPQAETPVEPAGAIEALAVEEPAGVSWTPFLVYLASWVVLAVGVVCLLRPAALDGGARWAPEYVWTLSAGIAMTGLGPLLALVVWLVTRARRDGEARRGLFVSALVKGAVVTFSGVVLWIVALYVLDLYAAGMLA